MITIEITVDTAKTDKLMADYPRRMAAAQSRSLRYIGATVASRATRAFREAALRPSIWAQRKPSKRDDGHPLLIRSGAMRQSIGWRIAGPDTVRIGSDKQYAIYHQTGTKKMPARPFYPVNRFGMLLPAVEGKIVRKVGDIFREELAGGM